MHFANWGKTLSCMHNKRKDCEDYGLQAVKTRSFRI